MCKRDSMLVKNSSVMSCPSVCSALEREPSSAGIDPTKRCKQLCKTSNVSIHSCGGGFATLTHDRTSISCRTHAVNLLAAQSGSAHVISNSLKAARM